MSKSDYKNKNAIPTDNKMGYVTKVDLNNINLKVSKVNGHPKWGQGGAVQVEIDPISIPENAWEKPERWEE